MPALMIDGKKAARSAEVAIKSLIKTSESKMGFKPQLAVIIVGQDSASEVYVGRKIEACKRVGIVSRYIALASNIQEEALIAEIAALNANDDVHGILVQLPLPEHIRTNVVIRAISPEKDVDGFHPENIGSLAARDPQLRPCTPLGIMSLLKPLVKSFHGQKAVIVGASNIVGRPMALELLLAGATVTICHRFTKKLADEVQAADILITAVGKAGLITGPMVKEGAIVIDVGMNRLDNGQLVGDVIYEDVQHKAAWITPVPGGVGPMTVSMLLANTCQAAYGENPIKI